MKLEDLRERPGVYTIWFGDEAYVGSALNLYVRIRRHQRGFGRGNHKNKTLLDAFLEHGSYRFEIEFCDGDTEPELRYYEKIVIGRQREAGYQLFNKIDPDTNPMAGKHHTDETKQKLSEAGKGRIPSDETKQKLREATKRQWEDPEYWERMSNQSKRMWRDPEHRENMERLWCDPEYLRRQSEAGHRGKAKQIAERGSVP